MMTAEALQTTRYSWRDVTEEMAPSARTEHSAVWTGNKMLIWGGKDANGSLLNTGGIYDPVSNSWSPITTTDAPAARSEHTAIWTGSKMIIWGGIASPYTILNDGKMYDPATNTWSSINSTGAPSIRTGYLAAWSGAKMIIWGGKAQTETWYSDGNLFDPEADSWSKISSTGTPPSARWKAQGISTSTRLFVWGGSNNGVDQFDGAVYDYATSKWSTSIPSTNAPTGNTKTTAVWLETPDEMTIWGGVTSSNEVTATGSNYTLEPSNWDATSNTNAPSARHNHTAIATDDEMIIWGGVTSSLEATPLTNTGAVYNATSDAWTALPTASAPSARMGHTAIWTGSKMIIWGGSETYSHIINTGSILENVSSSPVVVPSVANIESNAFPGAFLRMATDKINCQVGAGAWEQFNLVKQNDGSYSIESKNFDNYYLKIEDAPTAFSTSGSGKIVTQEITSGTIPDDCLFYITGEGSLVNIESKKYPGVFLRMDASDIPKKAVAHGFGHVNLQFGHLTWEAFILHKSA